MFGVELQDNEIHQWSVRNCCFQYKTKEKQHENNPVKQKCFIYG